MTNKKRLIDANALLERLESNTTDTWAKNLQAVRNWWPHAVGIKDNIVSMIKNEPTVDAVEVVRCKDCKYAMDMMPIENGSGCLMGECTLRKEDDIVFTAWGDDFCSYGERKDNEID